MQLYYEEKVADAFIYFLPHLQSSREIVLVRWRSSQKHQRKVQNSVTGVAVVKSRFIKFSN